MRVYAQNVIACLYYLKFKAFCLIARAIEHKFESTSGSFKLSVSNASLQTSSGYNTYTLYVAAVRFHRKGMGKTFTDVNLNRYTRGMPLAEISCLRGEEYSSRMIVI